MRRTAAEQANAAAEALLAWLGDQPSARRRAGPPAGPAAPADAAETAAPSGPPEIGVGADTSIAGAAPPESAPGFRCPASDADAPGDGASRVAQRGDASLRLVHTDWLHHRLAITGPARAVTAFREAAAGAGLIPWHLDLDRLEEDCFYRLVAPPAPQQRTLSLAGARILARQLRDAVRRRHEFARAQVARSRACPFDLYSLIPVPDDVLGLGRDDPAALAWLWTQWGTTEALRHVAEDTPAEPGRDPFPDDGEAAFRLTFWSADWTPWRALATLTARWPALRFTVRPTYDS